MRKRIKRLAVLMVIGVLILLGRLAQIQLISTENFSSRNFNLLEESVRQRSQEVIIDNGRGKFYDRNGISITHEAIPSLILFPFLKHMDWDVEEVARILNVDSEELIKAVEESKEPIVFGGSTPVELTDNQMEQINRLKIPGVYAVNKQFDRKETPAAQLIGVIGENEKILKERYPDKKIPSNTLIGITGLQKSFDEFLLQEEKSKLVYHVDGRGGPLFGIDVKYVDNTNPFYPVHVITTLDFEIQSFAEQLVDQHGIKKGGLVLLDIETNAVLALVSRPAMDVRNPFENNAAKNYMLSSEIPGSVFKTVIAAAAIDQNIVDSHRLFNCDVTIQGDPDPNYQYGERNFSESFALSCNNTFATLAKELQEIDPELIEKYAKRFGLLDPVGWHGQVFHFQDFKQFADEEKGQVFISEENKNDPNYVALTGIGQHDVRVTPLAVANMMATIARGGESRMVQTVSAIEFKNGSELFTFPSKKLNDEVISNYTTMNVQKLLREVVVHEGGTGRALRGLPYPVAGKSGTAETHIFEGNRQYVNKWFGGYFPFEKPKYALVVVNLGVFSDEGSVTPLYQDMVKYLYEYDQKHAKNQ